jgi:hypothetical protein
LILCYIYITLISCYSEFDNYIHSSTFIISTMAYLYGFWCLICTLFYIGEQYWIKLALYRKGFHLQIDTNSWGEIYMTCIFILYLRKIHPCFKGNLQFPSSIISLCISALIISFSLDTFDWNWQNMIARVWNISSIIMICL